MTNIRINDIRITGSQIWLNINNIDSCLGLYEASILLGKMTEKTIPIVSRTYHPHNDYKSFRNNFMFVLDRLLNQANYNRWFGVKDKIDVPYWVIDQIKDKEDHIKVVIRNIQGESINDD